MSFLKSFTKHEIFEKVVQIANIQIKDKLKFKRQTIKQSSIIQNSSQLPSTTQNIKHNQVFTQPTYLQAEQFILNLNFTSKQLSKKEMQKKTKKQIFQQLQIDPIYLQSMEIEFGNRYERTEVLHDYLNQVNRTMKKILFNQNLGENLERIPILQNFGLVEQNLQRLNTILTKIKFIRQCIRKIMTQKAIHIKNIMIKKVIITQKLSLLQSMKQKQQISLIKPQNLEQIYYSQRNRHKLYTKIKGMKIVNSYFTMLQNQIISISQNNAKIISKQLQSWINKKQEMREKNVEKLFICLYFVKTEALYRDNKIEVIFRGLDRENFVKEIQIVKGWKNYQYVRDPAIKGKISEFLNLLIEEINFIK